MPVLCISYPVLIFQWKNVVPDSYTSFVLHTVQFTDQGNKAGEHEHTCSINFKVMCILLLTG